MPAAPRIEAEGMSYTSLAFWGLLWVTLTGVALLPKGWRAWWLIAMSLVFYTSPDPIRLIWLGIILIVMIVALGVSRRGPSWPISGAAIAFLVALLVWAKFADAFGLGNPDAPPGLSFIIFTAIAVVIDLTRSHQAIGWRDGLLHLAWFPKLLAGPIERSTDLIPQFSSLAVRPAYMALGLSWLLVGLVKKLVIADSLAPTVDAAYAIPAYAPPVELLIASYFFAFQIYCDFSGYADIAIGLSLMVGLRLSLNFDRPYLSPTIGEFWASRWHISLAHWFRDYLYFPLGGSRKGWPRQMLNLMAVFLVSGLWHAGLGYGIGLGFLIWGGLNGLFVCLETRLPKPRRRVARIGGAIMTFHLVLLTWVFFRADGVGDALTILQRIAADFPEFWSLVVRYPFNSAQLTGVAMIIALLMCEAITGNAALAERVSGFGLPVRWASWYAMIAMLLLFGRWQDTEFIYAGF